MKDFNRVEVHVNGLEAEKVDVTTYGDAGWRKKQYTGKIFVDADVNIIQDSEIICQIKGGEFSFMTEKGEALGFEEAEERIKNLFK